MTNDELTELVKRALLDVAPDLEGEEFAPDETLADQFEIVQHGCDQISIGISHRIYDQLC